MKYLSDCLHDWYLYRKYPLGHIEDREHKLPLGETKIGRAINNNVQCASNVASRYHCVLYVDVHGAVYLKDLESTNGTFVGSEKIDPGKFSILNDHDLIGIGGNGENEDDESYVFELIQVKPVDDTNPTEKQGPITLNGSSSHTKSFDEELVSKEPIPVDAIPSSSHQSRLPSIPANQEIVCISDSDNESVRSKKEDVKLKIRGNLTHYDNKCGNKIIKEEVNQESSNLKNNSKQLDKNDISQSITAKKADSIVVENNYSINEVKRESISENETLKLNKSTISTQNESSINMGCDVGNQRNSVGNEKENLNDTPKGYAPKLDNLIDINIGESSSKPLDVNCGFDKHVVIESNLKTLTSNITNTSCLKTDEEPNANIAGKSTKKDCEEKNKLTSINLSTDNTTIQNDLSTDNRNSVENHNDTIKPKDNLPTSDKPTLIEIHVKNKTSNITNTSSSKRNIEPNKHIAGKSAKIVCEETNKQTSNNLPKSDNTTIKTNLSIDHRKSVAKDTDNMSDTPTSKDNEQTLAKTTDLKIRDSSSNPFHINCGFDKYANIEPNLKNATTVITNTYSSNTDEEPNKSIAGKSADKDYEENYKQTSNILPSSGNATKQNVLSVGSKSNRDPSSVSLKNRHGDEPIQKKTMTHGHLPRNTSSCQNNKTGINNDCSILDNKKSSSSLDNQNKYVENSSITTDKKESNYSKQITVDDNDNDQSKECKDQSILKQNRIGHNELVLNADSPKCSNKSQCEIQTIEKTTRQIHDKGNDYMDNNCANLNIESDPNSLKNIPSPKDNCQDISTRTSKEVEISTKVITPSAEVDSESIKIVHSLNHIQSDNLVLEGIGNIDQRRNSTVKTITNENSIPSTSLMGDRFECLIESTSTASASFTMEDDDDLIIINDDEEFPCSQRLEIKAENSYDIAESIDYHCNNDDYEGSDDDSSDEWFQKLSQCPYEEDNEQANIEEDEEVELGKKDNGQIDRASIQCRIGIKRKSTDISEDDEQEQLLSRTKIILPNNSCNLQSSNDKIIDSDEEEPLFRKVSGSKRKISETSDEEDNQIKINSNDKTIDSDEGEPLFRKVSGCKRKLSETSDEEDNKIEIDYNGDASEVLIKQQREIEHEEYRLSKAKKKQTAWTTHRFKSKIITKSRTSSIDSDQSSNSSKSQKTKKDIKRKSKNINTSEEIPQSKLIQARIIAAYNKFDKEDNERNMAYMNSIKPVETDLTKDCESKEEENMLVDIEDQITSTTIDKSQPLIKASHVNEEIVQLTKTCHLVSDMSDNNEICSFEKGHKTKDNSEDHLLTCHELPITNSQKLIAVNKKISESYKKAPIKIIDAKNLPVRKRKLENPASNNTLNKEKQSGWLSKSSTVKTVPTISKQEQKALIKKKLKNICKTKDTTLNTVEEHSKPTTTAKNTTKMTQKSRNALFLDTLNSSDGQEKKKDNTKDNSKDNYIKSYKIPRRQSKSEEIPIVNSRPVAEPSVRKSCIISKDQLEGKSTDYNKSKFAENKVNCMDKNNKCFSLVDQILTSKTSNSDSNVIPMKSITINKAVVGVENEEPIKVKYISDNFNQPPAITSTIKSILKVTSRRLFKDKSNIKKVKFCSPGEGNVVYVSVRDIEISEDAVLRPLTKNVTRKEPPPKRKIEVKSLIYTKYTDETLYQICKWNYLWFEESEKVKGEPPVYSGQVYQLRDSFSSYQDYRHTMLPLLLYELWQSVSRQYCQIKNRTNSIKIVIKRAHSLPLRNQTIPLLRANEQRVLTRLECQAVLEKDSRGEWPRQGDLLMLHLSHTNAKIKTTRVLAYLMSSSIRSIKLHKDVSPKLIQVISKASQVMDFTLFIRENLTIEPDKESSIYVLKNIKPELRQFDALDCLASSPLLDIILHPDKNNVPVPQVDVAKSAYRPIAHLNPSQKKAIVSVAKSIVEKPNMIQFVHGPPGCGKSEVIIGIILQIWNAWHHKEIRGCPQILLCAPSNAAIDDIFLRLMNIRQNITNMPKFNMVRIGRTDVTHKNVSSLTLDSIVEKQIKKNNSISEDSEMKVVELGRLEAKKNLLEYQRENPGHHKGNVNFMKDLDRKYAEVLESIKELEMGGYKKEFEGKEWRERKKELESTVLEKANIIATTLSSCFNAQMEHAYTNKRLNFTCCIVDEATQCTEPETLIPLMLGINTLVLVGDPMQLPATVLSEKAKSCGLQNSLFYRQWHWWQENKTGNNGAIFDSRYHFLTTQYRMHPEILHWPSDYFYRNLLIANGTLLQERPSCPLLPYTVLSHEFQQSNLNDSNYEEARIIVSLVNDMYKSRLCDGLTIGIITGYNKQKDLIKRRLDSINKKLVDVEIGTVDSYQGRERDIVVLSCVRTDGVGFLTDTRLNVAVTRARQSLIICGNFITLQVERDKTWASLIENAKSRGLFKLYDPNKRIILDIIKPEFASRV